MNQDRILPGIALMLLFCLLAPLLDVSAKLAAEGGIPVGEITTVRFAIQGALMVPVALLMRSPLRFGSGSLGLLVARAVLLIAATYSFIAAIRVMPLADALAIAFVEPFILLIASHFILGDHIGPRRIAACIVGFGGAILVIQPSISLFGLVALWPLGTAFSFAFYMLVTRLLAPRVPPVAMQVHTSWIGLVLCLPVVLIFARGPVHDLTLVMPVGIQWLWLFGVGFWAAASHMSMTLAFSFAPPATLASFHYSELIVAAALGYLIFGDLPNGMALAGIAVITVSGLYLIHRERQVERGRRLMLGDPMSG